MDHVTVSNADLLIQPIFKKKHMRSLKVLHEDTSLIHITALVPPGDGSESLMEC